jgi:hypothetical protein
VSFRGTDLADADFRGSDLGGSYLGGVDFRGTFLRDTYLEGAKISLPNGSESLLVGERPIIRVGLVGSRADELLAFITEGGVFLRTGCFWGSPEEFREKCAETHGTIGAHAEEYAAAIALIELHAKLWTPAKTEVKSCG